MSAKKAIVTTLVGIIIGVIAYSAIGIFVNTTNMRIYDNFPKSFLSDPSNPETMLSCSIRNNAPLSLPFINPFYILTVTIHDSQNSTFAYFGTGSDKRNFTDYSLDLGKIDSGSAANVDFYVHLANSNVTMTMEVKLPFLFLTFGASSATYSIVCLGDYNYTISKT